jgi:hypothetical protein
VNKRVRGSIATAALVTAALFSATFALASTPEECQGLRKHGHRDQANACFESLTQSREPAIRAEGFWGLEMYQDANN